MHTWDIKVCYLFLAKGIIHLFRKRSIILFSGKNFFLAVYAKGFKPRLSPRLRAQVEAACAADARNRRRLRGAGTKELKVIQECVLMGSGERDLVELVGRRQEERLGGGGGGIEVPFLTNDTFSESV